MIAVNPTYAPASLSSCWLQQQCWHCQGTEHHWQGQPQPAAHTHACIQTSCRSPQYTRSVHQTNASISVGRPLTALLLQKVLSTCRTTQCHCGTSLRRCHTHQPSRRTGCVRAVPTRKLSRKSCSSDHLLRRPDHDVVHFHVRGRRQAPQHCVCHIARLQALHR